MKDLHERQTRTSYLHFARTEAMTLHKIFVQRKVVLMLHFMLDIFEILQKFAKTLQFKVALLLDAIKWLLETVHELTLLKSRNRLHVRNLLQSSTCDSVLGCLSIHAFLNSASVEWREVKLMNVDSEQFPKDVPNLDEVKDLVINELIQNIRERFPKDISKLYEPFMPKNLPKTLPLPLNFGRSSVQKLSTTYRCNENELQRDWTLLLETLISSNHIDALLNESNQIH
jgi:hypothetical protein